MKELKPNDLHRLNKAVITGTIVATLTLASSCNLIRKAVLKVLKETAPISKPVK